MQTVTSYPWSLRKMFVFSFASSCLPIGAIYILMNREALQKRDFILYVLFAAINISLWLSLMIFDRSMWMVAGHYVLGAIIIVFSNMNNR
ncbi:hypothetical protein AAHB47_25465 [Bacillus wiedmannii]